MTDTLPCGCPVGIVRGDCDHWLTRKTIRTPIYIAGGTNEVRMCAENIKLIAMSPRYEVVHDWTKDVLDDGERGVNGQRTLSPERRAFLAWRDIHAVRQADILWVLIPESASYGAYVELGAAFMGSLDKQKTILVSGDWGKSLFFDLALRYDRHRDALKDLLGNTIGERTVR